ncbi:acid phosphatase (class A) [Granulicella rosea]|uniref:Acid phosphatase n=1 Tax=Granulicella rosea TaxID=474952 RepID=A0A239CXH2_9BACT|nr:phosphatase PAP2 family protein [Granulicella rosea]SNS24234.1 acid phosphatase (class A) [Granulicella rosea]
MSQRQGRAWMLACGTIFHVSLFALALRGRPAVAQEPAVARKAAKASLYLDPAALRLAALTPAPPAPDSAATQAELATLHRIETARSPAQVAAAKADDAEQDIFSYRTVFGAWFQPETLPLTAALSARVHAEEGAASGDLKTVFARPRPYQSDKTLHPVCKLTEAPNSYPSGHTLSGYLLGFTLAEMMPEKKQEILDRADDYAHNRLVCGVHYPSDLEASRRIAFAVFGAMMSNAKFVDDLTAASAELHAQQHAAVAAK